MCCRSSAAPDFEDPQDADGDNVYEVEVEVSDGDNAIPQTITVTVTPENDNVPAITSPADRRCGGEQHHSADPGSQ